MILALASQPRQALVVANYIRRERAAWKQRAFDGLVDVRVAIHEPPTYLRTMPVLDALCAVKYVGDVVARKVCSRAQVNPLRQLGQLTPRERNAVAQAMGEFKMFGGGA